MNTKCNGKSADVLLGLQWGDEGKGKIVDVLTPKYDIIARFQGGPNAPRKHKELLQLLWLMKSLNLQKETILETY